MKKKAQVHLLSTDTVKAGNNIFITTGGIRLQNIGEAAHVKEFSSSFKYWRPQYLYFTSDEPTRSGDWVYDFANNQVRKFEDIGTGKKIVATSNPELTKKSFVICARIGDDFVEAYIKAYNEGKPITEVMLEYVKERIGDEHDEFFFDTPKLRHGGTVIISPVVEPVYTLADMKSLAASLLTDFKLYVAENRETVFDESFNLKQWFDQKYPQ